MNPGDVLAGIETDKATVDFEMQEEGFIAKLLYPEGAMDVPLGEPIAVLVDSKDDIAAFADFVPGAAAAEEAPAAQSTSTSAATPAKQTMARSSGDRQFVSPLARKLAGEKNVDLGSVAGTGPNSRIIAADIEDALSAGNVKKSAVTVKKVAPSKAAAELPAHMFTDIENSQIRKVIAERLTHSK